MSSNVLERSAIKPFYIQKPSFYSQITTENKCDYSMEMRSRSTSKHNIRIKKEIDTLTKKFRESIIPSNSTINRPNTYFPKQENFCINLLTTPKLYKKSNNIGNGSLSKYSYKRFSREGGDPEHLNGNNNKFGLSIYELDSMLENFRKNRNKY